MRDFTEILKARNVNPSVPHPAPGRIQPCVPADTRALAHLPEDIDLAVKIGGFLDTLAAHQSATASEIAASICGKCYTLDDVIDIQRLSNELRQAGILVTGFDGFSFQLAGWAKSPKGHDPR